MSTNPTCAVPGCSRLAWKRAIMKKAHRDDENWLACRGHHWTITQEIQLDVSGEHCRIKGCGKARFARGLCKAHDKAARYHEAIDIVGTPATAMPPIPRRATSDDLGLLSEIVAPAVATAEYSPPPVAEVAMPTPEVVPDHAYELLVDAATPWHNHQAPNARCVLIPILDSAPIAFEPSAEPHPDPALSADEVLGMLPWADLVRVHQATRQILCSSTPLPPLKAQMAALLEYYAPELSPRARELAAELIAEVGQ